MANLRARNIAALPKCHRLTRSIVWARWDLASSGRWSRSSFTPIGRPPICDWPEETKLRRLNHPMDPRTVPLYVPREDRELVTNARCIADVDDKV